MLKKNRTQPLPTQPHLVQPKLPAPANLGNLQKLPAPAGHMSMKAPLE